MMLLFIKIVNIKIKPKVQKLYFHNPSSNSKLCRSSCFEAPTQTKFLNSTKCLNNSFQTSALK